MKKAILLLLSIFIVACASTSIVSTYEYFYRDTPHPQEVVDSLLGNRSSNFYEWPSSMVYGEYRGVESSITTYLNWVELNDTTALNVTITDWNVTDTCTVKCKLIKLK